MIRTSTKAIKQTIGRTNAVPAASTRYLSASPRFEDSEPTFHKGAFRTNPQDMNKRIHADWSKKSNRKASKSVPPMDQEKYFAQLGKEWSGSALDRSLENAKKNKSGVVAATKNSLAGTTASFQEVAASIQDMIPRVQETVQKGQETLQKAKAEAGPKLNKGKEAMNKGKEAVSETINSVKETKAESLQPGPAKGRQVVKEFNEELRQKAENAPSPETGRRVVEEFNKVHFGEGATDGTVSDKASNVATKAKREANLTVDSIKSKSEMKKEELRKSFEKNLDKAALKACDAADAVWETGEKATESVKNMAVQQKEVAKKAAEKQLKEASSKAREAASPTLEKTQDAFSQAKGKATQTLEKAKTSTQSPQEAAMTAKEKLTNMGSTFWQQAKKNFAGGSN